MSKEIRLKIHRLYKFLVNLSESNFTTNSLIVRRIAQVYSFPKSSNFSLKIDTKQYKPLCGLIKFLLNIIKNMDQLETFSLENRVSRQSIDFSVPHKQKIYKTLCRHSDSLIFISINSYQINELEFIGNCFKEGKLQNLQTLQFMDILPGKISLDLFDQICQNFKLCKSLKTIKISISHKFEYEILQLLKILLMVENIQEIFYSFLYFNEKICEEYCKLFEKPKITKIITKSFEFSNFCMNPFREIMFLKSSLKIVKFICTNQNIDTENNLIEINQFLRLISISSIEKFSIKNLCIKELPKITANIFYKNSQLQSLNFHNFCPIKDLSNFFISAENLVSEKLQKFQICTPLCDPKITTNFAKMLNNFCTEKLEFISLENCQIPDSQFVNLKLAKLFRKCKFLNLKGNYLLYNSYIEICELLKNSYKMQYLNITDCEVPQEKICEIFKVIEGHFSLCEFIWNFNFASILYESLNLLVKYNTKIQKFIMKSTNFMPINIFRTLKKSKNLEIFNIGISAFDNFAIRKLWKLLTKNNIIQKLKLNLERTNFESGFCSFEHIFKEILQRTKPHEIRFCLKKFSQDLSEFLIKILIQQKLQFKLFYRIKKISEFINNWFHLKICHSVLFLQEQKFVKNYTDFNIIIEDFLHNKSQNIIVFISYLI